MPHRHVAAQVLYVVSIIVVANFALDVLAGGFTNSVAVRGAKQAVTGA